MAICPLSCPMPYIPTSYEKRLALLVAKGLDDRAIADQLRRRVPGLTPRAVRDHIDQLRSKLPGTLKARARISVWVAQRRQG